MPNPYKHILVIRLSAMGDVAISVPVLRALIEQYPDLRITVLTRASFAPLFRGIANLSILEAEVEGKHKGLSGLWRLSKKIKRTGIDAVADLHNVLRSKILKLFLNGKAFIQIDKGRKERKALISGGAFQPIMPIYKRYAAVFDKLGFNIDMAAPKFPPRADMNTRCKNLVGESRRLIGIAPFAAFQSKTYPFHQMKEVIKNISKNDKVLLFGGGKQEVEILSKLESEIPNVVSLAGKLTLDEELDIISNLDVMVAMDSANAHMASMFNVEVITLWGVTHPYAGFYPFYQNPENAILADREKYPRIPTSIYGKTYPKGYENAIATISPEDIIKKIKKILAERDQISS